MKQTETIYATDGILVSSRKLGKVQTRPNPGAQGEDTIGFLASTDGFRNLCDNYDVEPTRRQASKFLNRKGRLYKIHTNMMQIGAKG